MRGFAIVELMTWMTISLAQYLRRAVTIPRLLAVVLAASSYTHAWFADASPNFALVTTSGTSKRMVVGGLEAGGQGLDALDISADTTTAPNGSAQSQAGPSCSRFPVNCR
jgi:hypothetical protein